jgi:Domain of unknown function (DUF4272)
MALPAPDPSAVRAANVAELRRLGLPLPPPQFPLVWEPGDEVMLRPTAEIEARAAVLNVVLARCFGMPHQDAMGWLLNARLVESVTQPEWRYVMTGQGDHRSFVLYFDALFALTWVLGLSKEIDPVSPADQGLMDRLPDLAGGESYREWRSRSLAAPRAASEVAAMLDLHYCLDWAYLEAERAGLALPGPIDSNAVGQRRWALEWAVVLLGPFHDPPSGWDQIDLA